MTIDECYAVLETPPGASLADVEKSYKLLAAVWRPDRFPRDSKLFSEAGDRLTRINQSYEALKVHLTESGDRQELNESADVTAEQHASPTTSLLRTNQVWTSIAGAVFAVVLLIAWIEWTMFITIALWIAVFAGELVATTTVCLMFDSKPEDRPGLACIGGGAALVAFVAWLLIPSSDDTGRAASFLQGQPTRAFDTPHEAEAVEVSSSACGEGLPAKSFASQILTVERSKASLGECPDPGDCTFLAPSIGDLASKSGWWRTRSERSTGLRFFRIKGVL